jgi:hypothetical protein
MHTKNIATQDARRAEGAHNCAGRRGEDGEVMAVSIYADCGLRTVDCGPLQVVI